MDRKKFVIIFSAIVIIGALAFLYKNCRNTELVSGNYRVAESTKDSTIQSRPELTVANQPTPLANFMSEEIDVGNNSAEFDMKAVLYEDSNKATYLKLEYYLDGASVIKELSETNIPEIKEIFKKRETNSPKGDGYRLGQMLLNTKNSKVYFTVIGVSASALCDTKVYSINLKEGIVKKLGNFYGRVGNMLFSKNGKYLAFSYLNSFLDSNHIEKEMLDIIECETDVFAIRYSRDSKKSVIGTNSKPGILYNYELKSWKTDTVLQLKQTEIPMAYSVVKAAKPVEVLYNIKKNLLLNSDGTAIIPNNEKSTTKAISDTKVDAASDVNKNITSNIDTNIDTKETESLKTMKSFYSYLAAVDNYSKAMNLLDEAFYLEIDLLKQFGVEKVIKKDIDAESATMYSDMLMAAKLDMVVKVDEVKDTSELYYYQTISLNAESQIKQALIMQLKKTASGWKIILIKEADSSKEPFAG